MLVLFCCQGNRIKTIALIATDKSRKQRDLFRNCQFSKWSRFYYSVELEQGFK